MQDNIETILLRKAGANRSEIEKVNKRVDQLVSRIEAIDKKITNVLLTVEAQFGGDREKYLRGEE